jgi:hypothetical protein
MRGSPMARCIVVAGLTPLSRLYMSYQYYGGIWEALAVAMRPSSACIDTLARARQSPRALLHAKHGANQSSIVYKRS